VNQDEAPDDQLGLVALEVPDQVPPHRASGHSACLPSASCTRFVSQVQQALRHRLPRPSRGWPLVTATIRTSSGDRPARAAAAAILDRTGAAFISLER